MAPNFSNNDNNNNYSGYPQGQDDDKVEIIPRQFPQYQPNQQYQQSNTALYSPQRFGSNNANIYPRQSESSLSQLTPRDREFAGVLAQSFNEAMQKFKESRPITFIINKEERSVTIKPERQCYHCSKVIFDAIHYCT